MNSIFLRIIFKGSIFSYFTYFICTYFGEGWAREDWGFVFLVHDGTFFIINFVYFKYFKLFFIVLFTAGSCFFIFVHKLKKKINSVLRTFIDSILHVVHGVLRYVLYRGMPVLLQH